MGNMMTTAEFIGEGTLREGLEEWGLGKQEFSLHHHIQ
jgi:hypothetical protein